MAWKTLASVVAIAALTAGCGPTEGDKEADAIEGTASEPAASDDEGKEDIAPKHAENELTCTYPVKAGDTAKSLMDRYGDDAKLATLDGPEGMQIPGVILWDSDPKRRVAVNFEDEARKTLTSVDVYEESDWTLAGIKANETLEKLRQVNGKPVKFFGFEWDYGGWVTDLGGGALDKLDGGCNAVFGLTYDYEKWQAPDSLVGDTEVSSESKDVNSKMIYIYTLGVSFPE